MGPTASGKTGVALELAQRLPLEVVSVDSALVYRGMDVGTAKPDTATRRQVPHHLVDIIEPTESYSAARFAEDATRLVAEIRSRGRLPLLVGGTMLYFKALREGLSGLPPADPATRAGLDAQAAAEGWPALHRRLAEVDPVTAARLEPGDAQRIQRALEVHILTGRPMSALLAEGRRRSSAGPMACVSLEPSDRSALHARIAQRFDAMLTQGLVEELRQLRDRHPLHPGLPSMRCVGYRQAWLHLDGQLDARGLREAGIAATRQLAKRQLTWLRSTEEVHRVDCLANDAAAQVLQHLRSRGAEP